MVIKNKVEQAVSHGTSLAERAGWATGGWLFGALMFVCAVAFVISTLLMLAPLSQVPSPLLQLPLSRLAAGIAFWLLNHLHAFANLQAQLGGDTVAFLILLAVAFIIYGLCALLVSLRAPENKNNRWLLLVWFTTLVAGLLLMLEGASLSHDVFVYTGYGRLMLVYHVNPYFVPPDQFPHDPLYHLNGWTNSTAAYGPLWLLVCAVSELFGGTDPIRYVLFFCSLGLAAHLVNTLLVTNILRAMGRSRRTVLLGTLLYAWNPLVLFEASNGGHNDIFMITFILLGILFAVRAEKRGQMGLRDYVLPVVAFTLAALVKFTLAPLVVLFIVLLIFYRLRQISWPFSDQDGQLSGAMSRPSHGADKSTPRPLPKYSVKVHNRPIQAVGDALLAIRTDAATKEATRRVLGAAVYASIISAVVVLLFYGPFFTGHSVHSIIQSFTSPPSSTGAHKSMLDAAQRWLAGHPLPHNTLQYKVVHELSSHKVWTLINVVVLALGMLVGMVWMWKAPRVRTFVMASLLVLEAFLLVAPWFLTWYIAWPVALVVVCLPVLYEPKGRALQAFALVFSASAFLLYLYNGAPPGYIWNPGSCVVTYGPPVLACLIFLALPFTRRVGQYAAA
ncbi:MAG TPA: hypothetical protein VKV20_08165 [Ktedonobacteraceae bacterium]|jgi:hypothetical protein|nr:hypothetical protein [Ktedonobacteraceae bacterium]